MTTFRHTLWLSAALALAVGPAGAGVVVEFDREVDFSAYRTFHWQQEPPPEGALTEKRIRVGIERELIAKGLREVRLEPDLWIATHFEAGTLTVELVDEASKEVVWRGVADGLSAKKPQKMEAKIFKSMARLFKGFPPKRK